MPVTNFVVDENQCSITVTAEYSVSRERLWNAYLDPRQIERFWAPPALSCRFIRHDAFAGGMSRYEMYGDDDEVYGGYWRWQNVDAPETFTVVDGFADEFGEAVDGAPSMSTNFTFTETDTGTRVTLTTTFESREALHTTLEMGVEAGTTAAMGQIDQLLDTLTPYAVEFDTTVQRISLNQLRISRRVKGKARDAWNAHTDPEKIRVWKRGQEGWSMPVCTFTPEAGSEYTMEWKNELGGQSFGVTGDVVQVIPEHRLVLTERFTDEDAAESLHEYTFTSFGSTTLITCVVTYSHEVDGHDAPDRALALGFEEGFDRLDRMLTG